MICLKDITKTYALGKRQVVAIKNLSLDVEKGEFIAIVGRSGCGKSSLMNILGCLDLPTTGTYTWEDTSITSLKDHELAMMRNKKIGFIFQKFNLLPRLSCIENITLPMMYAKKSNLNRQQALKALESVGLSGRLSHKPNELSGGEQQRVAIARALMNEPELLLADEPTGNLDSKTGTDVMSLLKNLNHQGMTIILVTHDEKIAAHAHRIIEMKDGEKSQEKRVSFPEKQTFFNTNTTQNVVRNDKPIDSKKWGSFVFQWSTFIKMAIQAILAHPLRSFLTMLGIIIGVAAVITMMALGEGAKKEITNKIVSLGSNLLMVRPGPAKQGYAKERGSFNYTTLKPKDIVALKKQSKLIKDLSPGYAENAQVSHGRNSKRTLIRGTTTAFLNVRNALINEGRFFNEEEEGQRVAVIGNTIKETLFENENPIGKMIKINRVIFRIIGTLEKKGASGFRDEDDVILIPLSTAQHRVFGVRHLTEIDIQVVSEEKMEDATLEITEILKEEHRIKTEEEMDFNIRSQAEILSTLEETSRSFTLLLSGIAIVSLMVGGIGIMNMMLVSVVERTKEIGIRKALGGQKKDILYQFLIEAIILSFLGGLIGIGLGIFSSWMANQWTSWTTVISTTSITLSAGFALLIGIAFGLWPAKKAADLHPIEALRYE